MIAKIAQWIEQTNASYRDQRYSCSTFADKFRGYYPAEFLDSAYFVIVDTIPKPDYPQLRQIEAVRDFLDQSDDGITYHDTYYIARGYESCDSLHFHELVHVAQWKTLGTSRFLHRYLNELETYQYKNAPLEDMAYGLQGRYERGDMVDVPQYVAQHLQGDVEGEGTLYRGWSETAKPQRQKWVLGD